MTDISEIINKYNIPVAHRIVPAVPNRLKDLITACMQDWVFSTVVSIPTHTPSQHKYVYGFSVALDHVNRMFTKNKHNIHKHNLNTSTTFKTYVPDPHPVDPNLEFPELLLSCGRLSYTAGRGAPQNVNHPV